METTLPASQEEVYRFKTNINCSGCVAKVTPALNAAKGIQHWEVDTNVKDKILSIHPQGISKQEVIEAVKSSGFKIETIE
ncbi:MAG: heavy-metal-associated domain-containing protein [Bacteroidetes bacterium]|nr:heavy-metal-associated domain-containing protein [Bacteroidota bacterium]